jgi:hypothetical protein
MGTKVLDGGQEDEAVVLSHTQEGVARLAQQGADTRAATLGARAAGVVMVDMERATVRTRVTSRPTTARTDALLGDEHLVVGRLRELVLDLQVLLPAIPAPGLPASLAVVLVVLTIVRAHARPTARLPPVPRGVAKVVLVQRLVEPACATSFHVDGSST